MAGVGGYQAPSHPAAVSGPGTLSQRTDGAAKFTMPDAPYGDGVELATQQAGAPMIKGQPTGGGVSAVPNGGSNIVGLDAPSAFPDEPVTAGVDAGEGPGSEVLPVGARVQPATGELTNLIFNLSAADRTGPLAALGMEAMRRGI